MIQIQNLNFSFKKGKPVFSELNLQAEKGEFIVVTGSSGSGKTTLLRILRMELFPDSGTFTIAGFPSSGKGNRKLVSLRRSVAVVYQDFRLVNEMTTFENVALTLRVRGVPEKRTKERVLRTLGEVGASHVAHFHPKELSGGEKQRVAIARAIIGKPLVLLADEPTGSLDPEASRDIIGLFQKINIGGTTVVLASHDPSLFGDERYRVLKITDGQLTAVENHV